MPTENENNNIGVVTQKEKYKMLISKEIGDLYVNCFQNIRHPGKARLGEKYEERPQTLVDNIRFREAEGLLEKATDLATFGLIRREGAYSRRKIESDNSSIKNIAKTAHNPNTVGSATHTEIAAINEFIYNTITKDEIDLESPEGYFLDFLVGRFVELNSQPFTEETTEHYRRLGIFLKQASEKYKIHYKNISFTGVNSAKEDNFLRCLKIISGEVTILERKANFLYKQSSIFEKISTIADTLKSYKRELLPYLVQPFTDIEVDHIISFSTINTSRCDKTLMESVKSCLSFGPEDSEEKTIAEHYYGALVKTLLYKNAEFISKSQYKYVKPLSMENIAEDNSGFADVLIRGDDNDKKSLDERQIKNTNILIENYNAIAKKCGTIDSLIASLTEIGNISKRHGDQSIAMNNRLYHLTTFNFDDLQKCVAECKTRTVKIGEAVNTIHEFESRKELKDDKEKVSISNTNVTNSIDRREALQSIAGSIIGKSKEIEELLANLRNVSPNHYDEAMKRVEEQVMNLAETEEVRSERKKMLSTIKEDSSVAVLIRHLKHEVSNSLIEKDKKEKINDKLDKVLEAAVTDIPKKLDEIEEINRLRCQMNECIVSIDSDDMKERANKIMEEIKTHCDEEENILLFEEVFPTLRENGKDTKPKLLASLADTIAEAASSLREIPNRHGLAKELEEGIILDFQNEVSNRVANIRKTLSSNSESVYTAMFNIYRQKIVNAEQEKPLPKSLSAKLAESDENHKENIQLKADLEKSNETIAKHEATITGLQGLITELKSLVDTMWNFIRFGTSTPLLERMKDQASLKELEECVKQITNTETSADDVKTASKKLKSLLLNREYAVSLFGGAKVKDGSSKEVVVPTTIKNVIAEIDKGGVDNAKEAMKIFSKAAENNSLFRNIGRHRTTQEMYKTLANASAASAPAA